MSFELASIDIDTINIDTSSRMGEAEIGKVRRLLED
jgi:hypothetical protein